MENIAGAMMLALLLAASLAACSKPDDGSDAPDFHPPTNATRADYLDLLDRRFARMDRDGDGLVQANEIGARRAAEIKSLDTDGDGQISREEFVKDGLARFDRVDINHDRVLTNAERH